MTNPRVTAEQLAEDRLWARNFLTRCGTNPDDQQHVRATYEATRDDHAKWMLGLGGEIDAETYGTLVYAVRALYGWLDWPLDWPAPTLVRMAQPFRNLLERDPVHVSYMSGVSDEDREWANRTVIDMAKELLLEQEPERGESG
jgi:hypothetical protein